MEFRRIQHLIRPAIFVLATAAAAVLGFNAGHTTAAAKPSVSSRQVTTASAAEVSVSNDARRSASDYRQLRVEGFGVVRLPEMLEIFQAVTAEQKQEWARQIAALPSTPQNRLAAISFYTAWVQFDPKDALASLLALPDRLLRSQLISGVELALPANALPEMAEGSLSLGPGERQRVMSAVLDQWSCSDPEAAAQFLTRNRNAVDMESVRKLFENWADDDPAASRRFLENSAEFHDNAGAIYGLVKSWAASDVTAAETYVRENANAPQFAAAIHVLSEQLFAASPERARDFVLSLDEKPARQAVAAVISEQMASGPEELEPLVSWLTQLPPTIAQSETGYVLGSWAARDASAVTEWLSHQEGKARDDMVANLCTYYPSDPSPELIALASGIRNGQARDAALRNLLRGSNPEEMSKTIRDLGLPAEQAQHLLELSRIQE